MKKLISIFAFGLAFAAIPVALATFVALPAWMHLLVDSTGLKVSPWYTGGEIARSIDHSSYLTRIHQPVFQSLLGERSEGFVQIDWWQKDKVPANLDEEIDFDGDGKNDFRITWRTRLEEPKLTILNPRVLGLEGGYRLSKSYSVRVKLRNPSAK